MDSDLETDPKPELTVIIPHLDAPADLSRCLKALSHDRNAGEDFSVIVVDNGSLTLPESICAEYDFVSLIHEPEPGPGPARNKGALCAQSPILAFIDCDCFAHKGWVSAIRKHFREHPETEIIGGDIRILRQENVELSEIGAFESIFAYRMKLYIDHYGYTATGNMAVRRDVFLKVGPFAGIGTSEDKDWGRRATAMGMQIDYVPEMKVETAACADFSELVRKWDRHISHAFSETDSMLDRIRWLLRALLVAASPLPDLLRIISSSRISGLHERRKAAACLMRIRLYRSYRMLELLAGRELSASQTWRQR